jgi:hypothetical protein
MTLSAEGIFDSIAQDNIIKYVKLMLSSGHGNSTYFPYDLV